MNLNPNINAQNDPLNQILANLPPIQVHANPPANPLAAPGQAAAQAAHNLAQQMPALAAIAPPAPLLLMVVAPNRPPQGLAPFIQPQGAPRRLRAGANPFQVVQFARGRNLLPQFINIAQDPAQPQSADSSHSSQFQFTPPSVCKPGLKRQFRDNDSDGSPGAGRWRGVRI